MDEQFDDADAILKRQRVQAKTGKSRSGLYSDMAQGLWPLAVSLGPRAVGWPAAEVAVMNAARIAGLSDGDIRALVTRLMAARASALTTAMSAHGLVASIPPQSDARQHSPRRAKWSAKISNKVISAGAEANQVAKQEGAQ